MKKIVQEYLINSFINDLNLYNGPELEDIINASIFSLLLNSAIFLIGIELIELPINVGESSKKQTTEYSPSICIRFDN